MLMSRQVFSMTTVTVDYRGYDKGVGHSIAIEEASSAIPINTHNWEYLGTYIFSEIRHYHSYYEELLDAEVEYTGKFEYDDNGDIIMDKSTLNSYKHHSQYGTASVQFSSPMLFSEAIDSYYLYNSNNHLYGSGYDDLLRGEGGNDVIIGYWGDDIIDGGTGGDRAVFIGSIDDYSYRLSSLCQLIITDTNLADGDEGMDLLAGLEELSFDGGSSTFSMQSFREAVLRSTPDNFSGNVSRLRNSLSGKYVFSSNQTEIDYLVGGEYGWTNEGISYLIPDNPTADVYRFLISDEGRHFFTASQDERDFIRTNFDNFIYEGVAFQSYSSTEFPSNAIPVVRFYNASSNTHLYSSSANEQSILSQDSQWTNEGIAWYGETF